MSKTAVALVGDKDNFRGMLSALKGQLSEVIPKHLEAERLINVACLAASRCPDLYKCTRASILKSFMLSSELGLEVGTPLQHAHLVPFFNSDIGAHEAVFIPGYQGLVYLAFQSGMLDSVQVNLVYDGDNFRINYEENPPYRHSPCLDPADRGKEIGGYCDALLATGGRQFRWVPTAEIDAIKARVRAKKGPWYDKDYEDRMREKTILKRGFKLMPMSIEVARAIEAEETYETTARDISEDLEGLPAITNAEKLKEKIAELPTAKKSTMTMVDDEQKKPKRKRRTKAEMEAAREKEKQSDTQDSEQETGFPVDSESFDDLLYRAHCVGLSKANLEEYCGCPFAEWTLGEHVSYLFAKLIVPLESGKTFEDLSLPNEWQLKEA